MRDKYPRFVAAREAAVAAEAARAGNQAQLAAQKGRGGGGTMGEGLVRAMAGVPAPFFEADYDLARCAEVQESLAAREADPSGAGQAVSINLLLQVTHDESTSRQSHTFQASWTLFGLRNSYGL